MDEKTKARIMDAVKIRRVLARVATEIIERNRNLKSLVIVGVKTRGVAIGKRLARLIGELEGVEIPVGTLDITRYRDDIPAPKSKPDLDRKDIGFPVVKKDVLLVDDVLMTGRTIRAAMDALIDRGRPQTVQLVVLIDRGHRELPIRPDYVGKVLPTSRREVVRVRLKETDGSEEVFIAEPVRIGGGRKR
ncbi:MAG: bifunctional pyr operon transcriptional regulator/uracil phosphoribosyltransferase PyrR [Candidatus Moduliflexus flocculans]|nr:bifunctional pyr operon transcriptional regulator/uracil phosphoribosyltransferase PyrR [Candidatus Moduliflexus flocculans]